MNSSLERSIFLLVVERHNLIGSSHFFYTCEGLQGLF